MKMVTSTFLVFYSFMVILMLKFDDLIFMGMLAIGAGAALAENEINFSSF